MRRGLGRWKADGAVGIKMVAQAYEEPSRAEAQSAFESLRDEAADSLPDRNPLRDYLLDQMLETAADLDLAVAVHTGVWGDYRTMDVEHMIPVFPRHPRTRFDVFHAGIPRVRETGLIGKNYPNTWLNICWCPLYSPRMAISFLREWLDLVPVNKIIVFGGDYSLPVEKTYGHLVITREVVAKVLGERVEEGSMSEEQALRVAARWFFDNANELYRLGL